MERRGDPQQQLQQGGDLPDVAAEGAVVLVALQSLEQLHQMGHLLVAQRCAEEGALGQPGKVGLGGGQFRQGAPADVQHIPGVEAGGDGAVQGVLSDEVQGAPAQGVDLVVDEDVAGADQGQHQLHIVVKVQPGDVPGLVVVELKMEFHVVHREPSCRRVRRKTAVLEKTYG